MMPGLGMRFSGAGPADLLEPHSEVPELQSLGSLAGGTE